MPVGVSVWHPETRGVFHCPQDMYGWAAWLIQDTASQGVLTDPGCLKQMGKDLPSGILLRIELQYPYGGSHRQFPHPLSVSSFPSCLLP